MWGAGDASHGYCTREHSKNGNFLTGYLLSRVSSLYTLPKSLIPNGQCKQEKAAQVLVHVLHTSQSLTCHMHVLTLTLPICSFSYRIWISLENVVFLQELKRSWISASWTSGRTENEHRQRLPPGMVWYSSSSVSHGVRSTKNEGLGHMSLLSDPARWLHTDLRLIYFSKSGPYAEMSLLFSTVPR